MSLKQLTVTTVGLLAPLLCFGCTPAAAPLAQQPPTNTTAAEDPVAEPPSTGTEEPAKPDELAEPDKPTADDATGGKPSGEEATDQADSETPPTSDDPEPASTVAVEPPVSAQRMLLFAPDHPLLIEFQVTVDGQPYDLALKQLLDEVLEQADTDGDQVATWDELAASPQFRYGQYGNMPIRTNADIRQMKQDYDINRNDRIERFEIPRFLTRNQGSTRAFTLVSNNQYRGDNQSRSLVKRLLDEDEDGAISSDEMQRAPLRLRTRDADEDDILFVGDFNPTSNLADNMGMMSRQRYGPPAAMLLDGQKTDWDTVLISLRELYAYGGSLGPAPFALDPELFEQLDGDNNQVLEAVELSLLLQARPHLTLAVNFGRPAAQPPAKDGEEAEDGNAEDDPAATESEVVADGDPEKASDEKPKAAKPAPQGPLQLLAVSPLLEENGQLRISQQASRLALNILGVEILFYVNNNLVGGDETAQAQAQLTQLDGDKNGYLDDSELPDGSFGLAEAFAALDEDEDKKVTLEEITSYLRRQQAARRSQIQASASDQQDALFTALDRNGDGRLTTREISAVGERLRELDRNQDGELKSNEIPGAMAVALSRGAGQLNGQPLQLPPPNLTPPADLPPWFLRMDLNRDGDISPLEFLGNSDRFESLDTNQDGFIQPAEARAVMKTAK